MNYITAPWSRCSGVDWNKVAWLHEHPELIARYEASREEAIVIKRLQAADRYLVSLADWPTKPPPLTHFDRPQHHRRPRVGPDAEHLWLTSCLASNFAGYRDRPDVARMREYLLAETLEQYPHSALYNLFSAIQPFEMHVLRVSEGMTIHELVRALHHSGVWRECLVRIIEPLADPPVRPKYLDAYEADMRSR